MTEIAVALVILAAGWLFARRWLRTRYMALREAGHPQYFGAVVAGVVLLMLGASIHVGATQTFPAWYPRADSKIFSILPQGMSSGINQAVLLTFGECALWALLLAWILPWLLNRPVYANACLLRAVMKRAGAFDAIEHICSHALDYGIQVAITLKTNKVYVGTPVSLSILDVERKWFILVPILSGYRDPTTFRFDLPTNYGETYQRILSQGADAERVIDEFRVVISISEVVSIQAFNISTYFEHFKKLHPLEGASSATGGQPVEELPLEKGGKFEGSSENTNDLAATAADQFTYEERFRMMAYNAFLCLGAIALLAIPYSLIATAILVFLSALCAAAAASECTFQDSEVEE